MILSLRLSGQIFAVCAAVLVCFASGPVFATADGPDHYRLVDVTVNNVLRRRNWDASAPVFARFWRGVYSTL